jgi:fatty-acyl-CoA synthase/long-chain acyl-CoA synthetase
VEDVLVRHPSVRRVAVIGVPHDDWGEAVHGVVVPDTDSLSADDLLAWARGELAAYARRAGRGRPARDPVREVDKKRLREPHWASRDREIA